MTEAFIVFALENLNSLIGEGIGGVLGVKKEMEKFSSKLSAICAVLEDAEKKQFTDRAIKDWLQKLNDVSCELDNVLDDCELEACRLQNHTWTRKVRSSTNVIFRIKIANKMKEIGNRLDEIADERTKFHLRESAGEMRRASQVGERRRTSSSIPELHVYGRGDDEEKVVSFLLHDAAKCKDLSVFPIVGLGGLGKTTLAKLVFNDERVSKHFEAKMWICVSDDFDLKRLVKEIIVSATNEKCEELEMDPLQKRLQDLLRGKRFLLVLDDIWNDDQYEWEELRNVLACGSAGSSIVVTTRLKKVASIMGTIPMFNLSSLSEDDCWSIFKERAFGSDGEEKPNLVKIGKEIVKKCNGVPLAAKSLGGLLFYKKEEREWLYIRDNELWDLPEEKVKILPELRLSYFHLPVEHRRCFSYCAIFPKDYEIDKQQLIHLWMANGLICSKGGREIEDIGKEIFDELCWVSFMQEEKDVDGDISHFKMHDLVHDLAQSIMRDECQYVEVKDSSLLNLPKRVRHVMIKPQWEAFYGTGHSVNISGGHSLRTLLNTDYGRFASFKFHSLRAFCFNDMQQSKMTSLISNMKHLRYLDLSNSAIEILPKSICSLHHLLTLDLHHCYDLAKLPKRLNCLERLRHLYIHGCNRLFATPPNIGKLSSLTILTKFMVSRNKGCGLDELRHLDLEDYLEIHNLEEVGNPMEAKSANLSEKKNLKRLSLSWNTRNENESHQETAKCILEALVPYTNLSTLSIHGYRGISFPYWMNGNEILGNITKITLSGCKNCVELPALGTLASLRNLDISGMKNVQYIDSQRYDGQPKRCFVQLREIVLEEMPNLKRLSKEEGPEMFPRLSDLNVAYCSKLSIKNLCGLASLRLDGDYEVTCFPGERLENLSALQSLEITNFTALQELSGDMLIGCPNLKRFNLSWCDKLKCFSNEIFRNSTCLQHISISDCPKLRSLPDSFGELTALQSLGISRCPELEGFPELKHLFSLRQLTIVDSGDLAEAFQHIPSLKSLAIYHYAKLASLPDWLGNLQSFRELQFSECRDLAEIPASLKRLTNLEKLTIRRCGSKLKERCRKEVGEDWDKIAHIPRVEY